MTIAVPDFDLTGRVALVTGASSGFGARFSRLLAAAGAKVVMGARRADRLAALEDEIRAAGGEALAVNMDVTDEASTIAAYDAGEAAFGPIDTIIANAGIAGDHVSLDAPVEEVDRIMATNQRGVFLTAREGAKRLIANGSAEREHGRIVIIGSITAERAHVAAAATYSATKAGVRQMGKVMAREWARKGISVNVIQPGYFITEIVGEMFESEGGQRFMNAFPRKRLHDVSSLDVPLLMFCSDHAHGLTGSVLTVDDGQTL